jgi:lipoprotein-anchoring transpeptidase ErfK/SrfK
MDACRKPLSRRDFLKLGAAGLLGLASAGLRLDPGLAAVPGQQGRVTVGLLSVRDRPSPDGTEVKQYWRDLVLPITGTGIDDDEKAYNRVWYQIGSEGYAYSGNIQPVRTVLNQPLTSLPPGGALVEVSVPFTDAHLGPGKASKVAYRLYYETTHWADQVTYDEEKRAWYRLLDDKFKTFYYAPAAHLRPLGENDLAPISPHIENVNKSIEIRLIQQLVVAYEHSTPVFAARTATGGRFRSGTYSTPIGRFLTYHKRPSRHMAAGDLASNGFDLPGVPWVLYITESGISLHGTYWHNDYGRPRSHGCINLTPAAAKWLYRWTEPVVPPGDEFAYKSYGTLVEIIE